MANKGNVKRPIKPSQMGSPTMKNIHNSMMGGPKSSGGGKKK